MLETASGYTPALPVYFRWPHLLVTPNNNALVEHASSTPLRNIEAATSHTNWDGKQEKKLEIYLKYDLERKDNKNT